MSPAYLVRQEGVDGHGLEHEQAMQQHGEVGEPLLDDRLELGHDVRHTAAAPLDGREGRGARRGEQKAGLVGLLAADFERQAELVHALVHLHESWDDAREFLHLQGLDGGGGGGGGGGQHVLVFVHEFEGDVLAAALRGFHGGAQVGEGGGGDGA